MTPAALAALDIGIIEFAGDGTVAANPAALDLLRAGRRAATRDALRLPAAVETWLDQVELSRRAVFSAETTFSDRPDLPAVDLGIKPLDPGLLMTLVPVAERIRQRERLDRADQQQTISRMLRVLAHELRNPLGGVKGAAQLIEQQTDRPQVGRHAVLIRREVDRITRLIEHFASGDEGDPEAVNIHRVLDEACELIEAESRRGVVVERDFDPSLPEVEAVSAALGQLFVNLVRNALQAGATRLRLTTRMAHDSPLPDAPRNAAVRIDIDDDGPGVPETLRPRLFLPLVTGRAAGSGFGLAICQQIARRHGGLVEYQPLDAGSRFRVHLPLSAADSRREPA